MRKIIVLLYFLVATVTGQMQLNNGQDQLVRINVQSPVEQALAFRNSYPGITRRKPCQRRRKIETPDGKPPVGGTVTTLHSTRVYPIDNKITREINNYEPLKPQSLKESKAISPENKGNVDPNVQSDSENLGVLTEQQPDEELTRGDSNNDSNEYLCQGDNDDLRAMKIDKKNKASPEEVQKQAIKLVTKCVQDAKNAVPEISSRRSANAAPLSEMSDSSGFNVPVHDDTADVNERDSLRHNNDQDASQPNMGLLRTNPSAVAERPDLPEVEANAHKSRGEILNELQHPVIGNFVTNISDSQSLKNARVCYACSSVNDPTCWNPNKFTTVKYCLKRYDKCLSKTVKTSADEQAIMIRDCGTTCNSNNLPGLTSYKSCRICNSDLCNSAVTIDNLNMLLVTFLMVAFKYAL